MNPTKSMRKSMPPIAQGTLEPILLSTAPQFPGRPRPQSVPGFQSHVDLADENPQRPVRERERKGKASIGAEMLEGARFRMAKRRNSPNAPRQEPGSANRVWSHNGPALGSEGRRDTRENEKECWMKGPNAAKSVLYDPLPQSSRTLICVLENRAGAASDWEAAAPRGTGVSAGHVLFLDPGAGYVDVLVL